MIELYKEQLSSVLVSIYCVFPVLFIYITFLRCSCLEPKLSFFALVLGASHGSLHSSTCLSILIALGIKAAGVPDSWHQSCRTATAEQGAAAVATTVVRLLAAGVRLVRAVDGLRACRTGFRFSPNMFELAISAYTFGGCAFARMTLWQGG